MTGILLTSQKVEVLIQLIQSLHTSTQNEEKQPSHKESGEETKCNATTTNCIFIKHITQIIIKYHTFINDKHHATNNNQYLNDLDLNIVDTLNLFNHTLSHHDNDQDFEFIYKLLSIQCSLENCKIIKRNRRNRKQLKFNYNKTRKLYEVNGNETISLKEDSRRIIVQQLMDTIHCHYLHSYHSGYRLTKNEKNILYNNHNQDHRSLDKLNELIKNNKQIFYKLTNIQSNTQNKFNSNLGQSSINNMHQDDIEVIEQYSYGFRLFYWDYYKNKNHRYLGMYYVPLKYDNLKQELLSNKISTIGFNQFNNEYDKAEIHKRSDYARLIHANIDRYATFDINV
eukprot:505007_1